MHLYAKDSLQDYYLSMSCHTSVKSIETPLYVIHALDDPIVPPTALPISDLEKNPNVIVALTTKGGHTGWLQGLFPTGLSFADRLCLEYLEATLNRIKWAENKVTKSTAPR